MKETNKKGIYYSSGISGMVHGEEWTTATAPPHRRPQGQSVPTGRPPGLSLHPLLHVPLAGTDPVHTHQQCE